MKESYFLPAILAAYCFFIFLLVSAGYVTDEYPVDRGVERQLKSKLDPIKNPHYKRAYFAGGCFWCVESNYEKIWGDDLYKR